jgi:hypothetical protein
MHDNELLVEFESIIDLDLAMYRFIKDKYSDSEYVDREFINDENERRVIYTLLNRKHINPLEVIMPGLETTNLYFDIMDKNIGLVNEFYVDSPMLPAAPDQYMLSIYLVAYGKFGSVVTSNVINPYISKGSGAYIRVENGYTQPIMKRALALAKKQEALASLEGEVLKDAEGNTLFALDATTLKTELYLADLGDTTLTDADGKSLIVEATRVLENINGWVFMQEGYTKDADGKWHINDIKYEVLVDEKGEIITGNDNKPIYIL